ncbi:MAG: molybdopterin biosynthesis protein [Candidatus Asgardarchaeia archaeon]
MRKIFRNLVTVEDALNMLYKVKPPKPIGVEKVHIGNALGRVLAEDVYSKVDNPPFDRAMYDGYAVIASDTYGADEENPIVLKKIGGVRTGELPRIEVSSGEAVEISTGAMIPKGANAVVMVEYTEEDDGKVYIYRGVKPGENIQFAGSDVMIGELILRKGEILTPREIGVLSAIGVEEVKVFKKPRVSIISIGDELEYLGEELKEGKIYDINSHTLSAMIFENGGIPISLGIVKDDPSEMISRIEDGLEFSDVVITSGSTSAGVMDILYNVIEGMEGSRIIAHGFKIKPGKPTFIAIVRGKVLFGLPGYPTSAMIAFQRIVRPYLRDMAGLPKVKLTKVRAKLVSKINVELGRRNFVPVVLTKREGLGYLAVPNFGPSGSITTLSNADGFIEIPENVGFLEENSDVYVYLFSSEIKPSDLIFSGSHCLGLDIISAIFRDRYPDIKIRVLNRGSVGGVISVMNGEGDIAGIHILDEKSGSYNIPFLKEVDKDRRLALIRGYVREQGIITRKDDERIKRPEDILNYRGLTIINRNPGSGTRILTDMVLKKICEQANIEFEKLKAEIKGYHTQAKSHNAVAASIKQGKADFGFGISTVAHIYGLRFIKIKDENYDFVVRREDLNKEYIQEFIDILKSKEFKERVRKKLPGIKVKKDVGDVILY